LKNPVIFVGCYGSGKTEWSINYAVHFLSLGRKVRLFDLDVVNPYFTVREYREDIARRGVEVISLPKEMMYADIPIFNPLTVALVGDTSHLNVVDVGGEPKGAKVLAQIKGSVVNGEYEMFMVVNTRRPFTEDVDSVLSLYEEIERASGLQITGIINNTNIGEFTDLEVVEEGQVVLSEVSRVTGVPLVYIGVMDGSLQRELKEAYPDVDVWLLKQFVDRCWKGGV